MINKFEAIGIFACVATMALALVLLRVESSSDFISSATSDSQVASIVSTSDFQNEEQALALALQDSVDSLGNMKKMISDDVIVGEGEEVVAGDTVSVHYIGTLQDGQQFDNSYTRGEQFSFTVGEGRVIKGWDQGVVGMKVGGQRILVIPPDLAYGESGVGPIPGNATLVFSIELLSIEK